MSELTVYELMLGAKFVWKTHENLNEFVIIQEIVNALTRVPINSEIVDRTSELKSGLMEKRLDVPDMDILIAFSDDDCEILTFDKDFEKLKEVGVRVKVLDR